MRSLKQLHKYAAGGSKSSASERFRTQTEALRTCAVDARRNNAAKPTVRSVAPRYMKVQPCPSVGESNENNDGCGMLCPLARPEIDTARRVNMPAKHGC